MKIYSKYLVLAIVMGILQTLFYSRTNVPILFSDLIFVLSFYKPIFYITAIMEMVAKLIPAFLFQIIYGTYIYRHFCSAGIYFFSRCSNRRKWFLKEALKLYGYSVLYLFTMTSASTAFCLINFEVHFDKGSLYLVICFLIIYSLWYYIAALSINIIAIVAGSQYSFVIIAGVQLILTLMLTIFDTWMPFENNVPMNKIILQLNPISHLVISWHSSKLAYINKLINTWNINFSFNISFAYLGLIALISTVVGINIINNKQFIITNNETGGI
ncbi:hypothetical protein [Anaeromicropila populeti]|uniref:ABC-2 type transport system permease protein n=1 Tax=Anaeromicropila populeti TaxID=37658 RepID=A0A1I6JT12_9FIRM|nr:hypothetical protein [Anaeromicropila populeti]SFR81680.1 hypothetical protein SAMN05661086_01923 [Anaeromicropila populeti]